MALDWPAAAGAQSRLFVSSMPTGYAITSSLHVLAEFYGRSDISSLQALSADEKNCFSLHVVIVAAGGKATAVTSSAPKI